jgi:hypothetical protein
MFSCIGTRIIAQREINRNCLTGFAAAALFLMLGCVNAGYRFERIDSDPPVPVPLELAGFYGVRDGANVNAEAYFVNGSDSVVMSIDIFLRPPAEFRSGTYKATIGGSISSGSVECPSLTFQGGQTALPNVGGTFLLNGPNGRPLYRVRIPATLLAGRARR